jgi:FkbM family methyltransferase
VRLLDDRLRAVGSDFFFVEIGANDGIRYDPLYRWVTTRRVRGLVVEPLPDLFEELRANYAAFPEVTPVCVALHRTEREIDLYRVDPRHTDLLEGKKCIASVHPEHHKRTGAPTEHIVRERVQCLTFDELLAQHQVSRIDCLQIDVEGYDGEILRMVDLERWRPAVVRFEHSAGLGVMSAQELTEHLSRLLAHGYRVSMSSTDVVAVPVSITPPSR